MQNIQVQCDEPQNQPRLCVLLCSLDQVPRSMFTGPGLKFSCSLDQVLNFLVHWTRFEILLFIGPGLKFLNLSQLLPLAILKTFLS